MARKLKPAIVGKIKSEENLDDVIPTHKQKLLGAYYATREMSPQEIAPFGEDRKWVDYSDTELTTLAGYSENNSTTTILTAPGTTKVIAHYLRFQEDYEKQNMAKTLRNINEGLDSEDQRYRLAYTTLNKNSLDKKEARESKTVINAENVNMLTIMGIN